MKKDSYNDSESKKSTNFTILLSLILLLGTALRFYDLGTESYWLDEMSTVLEGQQTVQELLMSGRFDQPPAYYIPFHFWIKNFGTSEVGTRSFSALIGTCSISLIYMIGRELFGKEVGVLSAFFMAISEYQIYYSQITRFYTFYLFTVLLSYLFFILALRYRKKIHYALYVTAGILMVYSHTYGIFILVAQSLFLILQWKKYRDVILTWIISQGLILLAFLPYVFLILLMEGGAESAIFSNAGNFPSPSVIDPLRAVYRFVLSPRRLRSWDWLLTNYVVAGVFLITSFWIFAVRRGKAYFQGSMKELHTNFQTMEDGAGKIILLGFWLLFPFMLPFIFSYIFFPLYKNEYMIGAAPALYLLMAFCVFSARKIVPLAIALGAYAIMILPSLNYYYISDINEQWSEVAAYIEKNSDPSEIVIIAPDMGNGKFLGKQQKLFNWYYQGNLQSCGLVNGLVEPNDISEALMQCISGYNRFWLVMPDYPYPGGTADDSFRLFFLDPNQKTMHLLEEHQFVQISVYLFELVE